ncbi:uncharacterized protein N7496_003856 [Penicillium cataractarum]|uniref:O-methyltransferase C-terminal domain-containing protein n=1 Tax=Penicillium cataractarum TaxID=2100454 RepID=A0A9W9VGL5_9EURO|nr:uncharacterized protein N7496_003856 [Penicillium cataractarum]KAJ5381428.1 hypothetical protein N7496_003856 [Penicillium cataractarum]
MDSTPDQDRRVGDLLDQLCHLREQLRLLNRPLEEQDKGDGERKELLKRVGTVSHQLALAAQEPHEAYWDLIRRDMEVFRYLKEHGGMKIDELASNLGAEEGLIEGLLVQSEQGIYSLTEHGLIFALPAYEDSCKFAVEFLPVVLFNPTFFQQYGYREPRSHDGFDTPLAAYFKKPGYGFFDYLRDHPSVQKLFISAMHAQARTQSILCSVYDYEARLPLVGDDPSAVAIVDVGGSQGELLLDLRARYPQIKGRMIVLDQKSTLQSLLQEPPVGIELVVHDIFTELPVKGAAVYHLKRILHDWSDHSARIILKHVVSAMDPERSKVLIMDAVLPSTNTSLSQAMGDHSMLTFGGKERTEGDWRTLLESVGLVIEHIYQGPEPEALIECRKA